MCDECDTEPCVCGDAEILSPGANWPFTGKSRMNWTDPVIVLTTSVGYFGQAISQIANLAGSMLRAHSNTIFEKQDRARFKVEADDLIKQLSGG